jgi:hypothetical protein
LFDATEHDFPALVTDAVSQTAEEWLADLKGSE